MTNHAPDNQGVTTPPLDMAVDEALAVLRRVGKVAERQGEWGLRRITDQMASDLLDAWEATE